MSGVAAAAASKVGLGGAWETVVLLRPDISDDRPRTSDLRFLVPRLGPRTRKADGEVDGQVDEMDGQGEGGASSRRHQELGVSIVCGLRWQPTRSESCSTLQSSVEAMLAADLVRSSQFLPFGDCGCASSRLHQELEIFIVWGAALAADMISSSKFLLFGRPALAAAVEALLEQT